MRRGNLCDAPYSMSSKTFLTLSGKSLNLADLVKMGVLERLDLISACYGVMC